MSNELLRDDERRALALLSDYPGSCDLLRSRLIEARAREREPHKCACVIEGDILKTICAYHNAYYSSCYLELEAKYRDSLVKVRELERERDEAEHNNADLSVRIARLVGERDDALALVRRYEKAIRWALGEIGAFPLRGENDGAYWWRRELRRMAQLPERELVKEKA